MNIGKESENTEFKKGLGQLDKGLKSLSGMLNNTSYGIIYFGVDDDGEILGIKNSEISIDKIKEKVNKIEPKIYPNIELLQIDNLKSYVKVEANENNGPYSYDGRYYVRNYTSTEKATNEILRKIILDSSPDYLTSKKSPIQLLTFNALSAYLQRYNHLFRNSIESYKTYKLLDNQNDFNYLAYLLSDQNDLSIRVYRFAGIKKTKMIKMDDFGHKCIIETIDEILTSLESINLTAVNLENKQRQEVRLFNYPCVKEATINAFAHNNWLKESPCIYIFDNRIEIHSQGGLPYNLKLKNFYNGESKPVNISLLDILIKVKFAEHSGHGVPTIIEGYGKNVFAIEDDSITVNIPFSYMAEETLLPIIKNIQELNSNQLKVYTLLQKNGNLTISQLSKKLKLSESGIKKILKKLQDMNLLERVGSQKTGHWHIRI